MYRKPAKVIGGISTKPHFIIIKEDDQRNVTSIACSIGIKCDCFFTITIYNQFSMFITNPSDDIIIDSYIIIVKYIHIVDTDGIPIL